MKTFNQFIATLIDDSDCPATPRQVLMLKELCILRGITFPYINIQHCIDSMSQTEIKNVISDLANDLGWSIQNDYSFQ